MLSVFAETHADELTNARAGYLPIKEVHSKIKEMEDRYNTTYKACEGVKAEAAEWREKFSALELKKVKEQTAMESTITGLQTRHDALKKVVLEHCRRILGKYPHFFSLATERSESPSID